MPTEYTGAAECSEIPESAQEDYDDENGLMSASVTLRCAYADRHTVAGDICANRRPWPKGSYGLVPRAIRASIKPELNRPDGFVANSQMFIPLTALATIYYSTKTADIITESVEPTAEHGTLDYRLFAWGSGTGDSIREEEAPTFLERGCNLVRTSYYVFPSPSFDPNLLALIGFVNDRVYVSGLLTLAFGEGTLLYGPPVINRKLNSNGIQNFDVTKRWTYKAQGWNWFYRTRDQMFQQIYLRGSPDPYLQYPEGDMTSLLLW
jgi:hypothetical protein